MLSKKSISVLLTILFICLAVLTGGFIYARKTLITKIDAEHEFREFLDSAPDAIAVVNEKGTIELVNKQTEKLFGVEYKLKQLNAELEEKVQDRTAQLELANNELGSFTNSVSHDLRVPLRIIDGYADILIKFIKEDILPAECDTNLLGQLCVNLISNAVKYSAAKEKPVIEIGSFHAQDENIYMLKDNGVGFNVKCSSKPFGVFKRLHKMSEYKGTGVGLALVKRIIVKHGGRVWANAEPENDATFCFSIPDKSNN
jgi:light-regulated signal transduction histidine kinase (bacteriophytochrome)